MSVRRACVLEGEIGGHNHGSMAEEEDKEEGEDSGEEEKEDDNRKGNGRTTLAKGRRCIGGRGIEEEEAEDGIEGSGTEA